MNDKSTYFNFPICLIDRIFSDKMKVLNDIFNYAIYAHSLNLNNSKFMKYYCAKNFAEMEPIDKIKASLNWFGVTSGNDNNTLKNGKQLYDSIPYKSPKTSIKKDLYFDFYQNDKTEFEIAVLCGFLAIRSILLYKPYCKITDNFMLVRMAGRAKVEEIDSLPEAFQKYLKTPDTKRYHLEKIKKELKHHWNLKTYGRHTRGFYVSFDLSLEDLILEAEKKRKKYIEKNYKTIEAEARKQALRKLYESTAPLQHL